MSTRATSHIEELKFWMAKTFDSSDSILCPVVYVGGGAIVVLLRTQPWDRASAPSHIPGSGGGPKAQYFYFRVKFSKTVETTS